MRLILLRRTRVEQDCLVPAFLWRAIATRKALEQPLELALLECHPYEGLGRPCGGIARRGAEQSLLGEAASRCLAIEATLATLWGTAAELGLSVGDASATIAFADDRRRFSEVLRTKTGEERRRRRGGRIAQSAIRKAQPHPIRVLARGTTADFGRRDPSNLRAGQEQVEAPSLEGAQPLMGFCAHTESLTKRQIEPSTRAGYAGIPRPDRQITRGKPVLGGEGPARLVRPPDRP